jgi:hypothetical protein
LHQVGYSFTLWLWCTVTQTSKTDSCIYYLFFHSWLIPSDLVKWFTAALRNYATTVMSLQ